MEATPKHGEWHGLPKNKPKIAVFLFSYIKISVGVVFPSCSCVKVLAYFLKVLFCQCKLSLTELILLARFEVSP